MSKAVVILPRLIGSRTSATLLTENLAPDLSKSELVFDFRSNLVVNRSVCNELMRQAAERNARHVTVENASDDVFADMQYTAGVHFKDRVLELNRSSF